MLPLCMHKAAYRIMWMHVLACLSIGMSLCMGFIEPCSRSVVGVHTDLMLAGNARATETYRQYVRVVYTIRELSACTWHWHRVQ